MARELPAAACIAGDAIVPMYLGAADHPWITRVVDAVEALAERPRREVLERLAPAELGAPPAKLALVIEALRASMRYQTRAAADPREVRLALCSERAQRRGARAQVVESVAARFAVTAAAVEHAMFADISAEQMLTLAEELPAVADLAALANQRLVRAILARSAHVTVELWGNSRAVVRQARLRGLIVSVERAGLGASDLTRMSVSGPLSLFRQTSLYGRALGELVPQLVWCERFSLRAVVPVRDRRLSLQVGSGAALFPARRPRPFDSGLERRFARELARAAPAWRLVREPAPVDVEGALIFPDFEIVHREDPRRRFLLEIVGFWTADYLRKKLDGLRRARLPNLILCIDERRGCDGAELPGGAHVVRYRGNRIDCGEVLRWITANGGCDPRAPICQS